MQALGNGRQDLGFAFGDAGSGQPLWRAAVEAGHGGILPGQAEHWMPTLGAVDHPASTTGGPDEDPAHGTDCGRRRPDTGSPRWLEVVNDI